MIMTNLMLHGRRLITTSTPTSSRGGSVVSTYQRTLFSTYFSSDDNPTSSTTASDTNTITASNSTFSGVMSKGDLIKMIAEDNDMSQAQSGRIVNSIFDTIIEVSKIISCQTMSFQKFFVSKRAYELRKFKV